MPLREDSWLGISIGIWNGSQTGRGGRLLYRALLEDAMNQGLQGGTAWRVIEGGNQRGIFRSIESEVASNGLPVWLQFIDNADRGLRWLPSATRIVGDGGMIVLDKHNHRQLHFESTAEGGSQTVLTDAVATQGIQVTIYTLETNKVHGKLVYQAVAEYLRHRDVLWVATMRGLGGFGEGREIRESGWFRKQDTPIMMVVVDKAEKISPLLGGLVELVGNQGTVVRTEVSWVHP